MPPGNRVPDELIGMRIGGRYRVIARLGAGGMGTAYRAWDERAGIPVVVKIPKKALFFADERFAERFRREIRLLRGGRHPHVVPVVDDGVHDGLPFLVMRFLPGGSLADRRLRGDEGEFLPNPSGMLHLWLPAVAQALDHVHARDVVHRDVKPANIFFDATWCAFLADFGIAKSIGRNEEEDPEESLTGDGRNVGTYSYMAPEQFKAGSWIDGRSDQYSLAVVVYEMLAATRPFTGDQAVVIAGVTTQTPPTITTYRDDLPASLVDAVHRGLEKHPNHRFATCTDFAAAVLMEVPFLADEPGIARLRCPSCGRMLKLSTAYAGRRGRCPKCQARMQVAKDLDALWLPNESRPPPVPDGGGHDDQDPWAGLSSTDDQPGYEASPDEIWAEEPSPPPEADGTHLWGQFQQAKRPPDEQAAFPEFRFRPRYMRRRKEISPASQAMIASALAVLVVLLVLLFLQNYR